MRIVFHASLWFFMTFASLGNAQVWFNAVPNTIVNNPVVDPAAQTKVNQNFASLVSDGNTGQTSILATLAGIGPVGVPQHAVIMWSGSTCPTGYQTADGTNGTADARGVFIRGLDTSGAIDPGRTLASFQADQFINHTHGAPVVVASMVFSSSTFAGATAVTNGIAASTAPTTLGMNSPSGGTETRPPAFVMLLCEKL